MSTLGRRIAIAVFIFAATVLFIFYAYVTIVAYLHNSVTVTINEIRTESLVLPVVKLQLETQRSFDEADSVLNRMAFAASIDIDAVPFWASPVNHIPFSSALTMGWMHSIVLNRVSLKVKKFFNFNNRNVFYVFAVNYCRMW